MSCAGRLVAMPRLILSLLAMAGVSGVAGCSKPTTAGSAQVPPARHEHKPPHGGTAVVLGNENFHLELVRGETADILLAYVLDGEMENFVRSSAPSFEVAAIARTHADSRTLVFRAVASSATGETVGDTAAFAAQDEWLRTNGSFDAVLKSITVRGSTFTHVDFHFPEGNDRAP
jgi:hypothetical protein